MLGHHDGEEGAETVSHQGASGGKVSAISQAVTIALPSARNSPSGWPRSLSISRLAGQRRERGERQLQQDRRADQPDVDGDARQQARPAPVASHGARWRCPVHHSPGRSWLVAESARPP
jgi:hypothetical protein